MTNDFEKSLYKDKNIKSDEVCGVDEAGRGPLAGRVYASAVILPENACEIEELKGLDDSKKLSEKKREKLAESIKKYALSYCVAYAEKDEIEEINILNAALLAMNRAISGLDKKARFAIIDGNANKNIIIPSVTVVGGDAKCPSVAAASILAKTERDRYCVEYLDKKYPEYNFAKHKGYGTKEHYAAVEKHGLCKEHRESFFKKYFGSREKKENDSHR